MQTFHFDLSTKSVAPVLHVKQGDVGRRFRAVVTDGGAAYTIPAGAQFSVWFSGPSGEGNYSAIGDRSAFTVEGNTVTVELIAQMLVNAGTGSMCLVLSSDDGTQLGLWNMVYAVEHVPGMGSKAAEDYYTALSELARQAIDAAAAFETDTTLSVSGKAADAAVVGEKLAGKAPNGYGLGETAPRTVSSLDDVARPGWYKMWFNAGDVPDGAIYGTWNFFVIDYADPDNFTIKLPINHNWEDYSVLSELRRRKWGGVWQPWEWEHPPMVLGVEYRTTERWEGKPVYVQAVSLNALPAGQLKFVYPATPIAHTAKLVDLFGTVHYSGGNMKPLCKENRLDVAINIGDNTWRLDLTATADLSAHIGNATLKYCKE